MVAMGCLDRGVNAIFPNNFGQIKPALVKAELPLFRLYDLRHTHATLLLLDGENPKVAAERLGYSTIVLTLHTYSHLLPDMQEEAAKRIEKVLFGKMSA